MDVVIEIILFIPARSSSISSLTSTGQYSITPVEGGTNTSILRSFVLLLALSFHSVFEGIAVGLQDTVSATLQISGALSMHKFIIAFSLGQNLSSNDRLTAASILRSCILFCAMSPLGIGIGIAIMNAMKDDTRVSLLVNGTILGVACGTFLYVVFFEILPREFLMDVDAVTAQAGGLLKVCLMITGFGIISLIMFLDSDDD